LILVAIRGPRLITRVTDIPLRTIVTRTKGSDFPSPLRQKLSSVQTVDKNSIQSGQIDPNMDCSKCGRVGIRYTEAQMRGADEGSTIMYNCECGNKYVETTLWALWCLLTGPQVEHEQLNGDALEYFMGIYRRPTSTVPTTYPVSF